MFFGVNKVGIPLGHHLLPSHIVLVIVMYVTRKVDWRRELEPPKNTLNSRNTAQGMEAGWNFVGIASLDAKSCQLRLHVVQRAVLSLVLFLGD